MRVIIKACRTISLLDKPFIFRFFNFRVISYIEKSLIRPIEKLLSLFTQSLIFKYYVQKYVVNGKKYYYYVFIVST